MITIPPGESFDLKLRFKPQGPGTRLGRVSFDSNAPHSSHVIQLEGQGLDAIEPPEGISPLTAVGSILVDESGTGEMKVLRAINWYGFEAIGIPQGAWARPFRTKVVNNQMAKGMLDEIKELGFNCIRFPICQDITWTGFRPETRYAMWNTTYIDPRLNPEFLINLGQTNPQAVRLSIEILDIIVKWCEELKLRIIFDMHCLAPDDDNVQGTGGKWYTTAGPDLPGASNSERREPRNEQQAINALTFLANRYKERSIVVGFDLLNEPYNCTWDRDSQTGIVGYYERAGKAIHEFNPDVLIICEGIAGKVDHSPEDDPDNPEYLWDAFWGGKLDQALATPVTLTVPNKVVYSPHEYGSFLTGVPIKPWFNPTGTVPTYVGKPFPENMPDVWSKQWGYLAEQNEYPILIGEFGSYFRVGGDPVGGGGTGYTEQNLAYDEQWIDALRQYCEMHNISFAYWAWNPGGDPDGLLSHTSETEWGSPQEFKLDLIRAMLPGGISQFALLDNDNLPLQDSSSAILEGDHA